MAKTDKTSNIYLNGEQAGKTLAELRKAARKLSNEIYQMKEGSDEYNAAMQKLGLLNSKIINHKNKVREISNSYKEVKKSMNPIMQMAVGFFAGGLIQKGVDLVVGAIGGWITKNRELEKALSSLRSLTGASKEDLKFYKEEAIAMGKSTTQSATQVIDAMKLVGSSRPDLLKNKEALAAVTRETITLAEAAEMEMGPAADAVTGIMNQFNLTAKETPRIINAIAAGSQAGAADIPALSQAIDKSGSVMKGYNIEVEQGIGLLETMAEKNIKGAEAGTQLRNVLLTMQGIEVLPEKALKSIEKYGVDTAKVADETVPLQERLTEMSKISGDATAMMQVFGRENITAANAILQNVDKVQKFTEAVTDTNTAYEQAAINTDNLEGDQKALASAWEGLNLSIEGSNSVMRFFVQNTTSVVNWVTDTVNAFKNWDTTAMETSLLKLGKGLVSLADPFGWWSDELKKSIDESIRFNNLTQQVIDKTEAATRSVTIRTAALKQNKIAMDSGNLSEEESVKIKEESARIIDSLKDQYPELTEEIDLQSASLEELDQYQKIVTDNILKQAIEEVKAAEQKRILNEIIQETISLQKALAVEQEIENSDGFTKFVANIGAAFVDGSEDFQGNIDVLKSQLEGLDETFNGVSETISNMELDFAADFTANNELINQSTEELDKLIQKLEGAKEGNSLFIEQSIKAYQQLISETKKMQDKLIEESIAESEKRKELIAKAVQLGYKGAMDVENEIFESFIQKATDAASRAAKAKSKEEIKEHEKLLNELQKLEEKAANTSQELENMKLLASKEGRERDMAEMEIQLNKKYEREIASLQELAKKQGEIGERARDQLANMEKLKEDEKLFQIEQIKEKWRQIDEKNTRDLEERKRQIAVSIQDARYKSEISGEMDHLNQLHDFEFGKKKDALANLFQLKKDQAEFENQSEMDSLRFKLENEEITKEEFELLREQKEAEHLDRIDSVREEYAQLDEARQRDAAAAALEATSAAIDLVMQFQKNAHDKKMIQISKEKKAEIAQLDERLEKGLVSEERYAQEKEAIDKEYAEKERQEKIKQFEAEKRAAIAQAIIQTALAAVKAAPNPITIALALATGAAQIAVIASQPVPQFKDGGYNVTGAQDGKTYNAKYLGKHPGGMLPDHPVVLASEAGPEYFVPNPLLSNPEVINHVRAIENIRRGNTIRQFAVGGATEPLPEMNQDPAGVSSSSRESQVMNQRMIEFLDANLRTLQELQSTIPNIRAVIDDPTADELNERMKQIDAIRA